VVPELRQFPVRADLAGVERERLLVGEGQEELPPGPIGHVEELGNPVAPRRLPQLDRGQQWAEELLPADCVHLLADDLLHLAVDPPAEWEVRPQPGADLSDEPAPDEELVADRLRVGGILAQGRQEQL
jgi:hypothetical protein